MRWKKDVPEKIKQIDQLFDEKKIDKSPDWKPANLKEEIEIFNAYMKNHPNLKFDEGVILGNRRAHVMRLIAAEKKRDAKREKKRAIIIQSNLPDKPPVSSQGINEKTNDQELPGGARVMLM